ncbi:MAG: hypothetical protein QW735_00940 [archaeon]
MKGTLDFDFMMSLLLFLTIYFSVYLFLPDLMQDVLSTKDYRQSIVSNIAEYIISQPGFPENWTNISDAELFGLAVSGERNIISLEKAKALHNQPCDLIKTPLEFKVKVKVVAGNTEFSCEGYQNFTRIRRNVFIFDGENYTQGVVEVYVD